MRWQLPRSRRRQILPVLLTSLHADMLVHGRSTRLQCTKTKLRLLRYITHTRITTSMSSKHAGIVPPPLEALVAAEQRTVSFLCPHTLYGPHTVLAGGRTLSTQ